jgi:hypothetical protein
MSSISLVSRNVRGSYGNAGLDNSAQIDSGYTERQLELQADWHLTGKSTLGGTLRKIKRQYPVFTQRDFSGVEKGINYAWGVSGKTYLNMSMNRIVNSWFDTASSYYVTDTVSISPGWQISAKVNSHISLQRSKTDYRNPIVADAVGRNDVLQFQEAGMGWTPDRFMTFNFSLQHSRRNSNYSTYEFSDRSATINVMATF